MMFFFLELRTCNFFLQGEVPQYEQSDKSRKSTGPKITVLTSEEAAKTG